MASQVHRSWRAEFLLPELVSSYLVRLQEGLKGWIENSGVGSLLRARLSRGNSPWRTDKKIGEGGSMKRKHLVMVLDTLEYLGPGGAAWVVSDVSFLEDGFLVLGEGRVAAFTTAPVCGWPGQLHVLKFNVAALFAFLLRS